MRRDLRQLPHEWRRTWTLPPLSDKQHARKAGYEDVAMSLTAVQWRQRAEESRVLAEQMSDAASRGAMLRIAADYEILAQNADRIESTRMLLEKRAAPPDGFV